MTRARMTGLATVVGAALLLAVLFHPPAPPWSRTLDVSLEAASFGELDPGASVELAGIEVGTVEGLDIRRGRPVIRMSIDRAYADQLHADTTAIIRPHGLLGPRYVELEGGSHGWLADGATIPISRVHVTTDLDEVLNALQPDVRQSLQTLIVELGEASDGRGQDLNAALKSLGDATDDVATVTATLHRHDQDVAASVVDAERVNRDLQAAPLAAQVRDTDTVLRGLVQVDGSFGDGIDHTANTLQALDVVLDGNQDNLARTLNEAPATVTRLRAVLAELTALVDGVNPSVPSLLTAVVETKSAFAGSDANGHFVRIQTLLGTCTAGLDAGCATPGAPAPADPNADHTHSNGPVPAVRPVPAPEPPRSRISDQELLRLFLGDQ